MHDLLDDWAQSNALRDTNARLKLLLGLGAILISVSSVTPLAPLFVAVTMSLITVMLAKIPGRFYSRLLLLPLSFAMLSAGVVAFMHGSGQTLFAVDIFGLQLSIARGWSKPGPPPDRQNLRRHDALFFIALTTPMIEIFAVLKSLRIPESVLELSMMIYRYIFVFLDQAAMIHNAQVMRLGDAGTRNSLDSFAMLSSVLFLRSWEQGERLIVAMDARCYNGMLDLMDQSPGPKPGEIFAVVAYLLLVMAFAALTGNIHLL